jgi:hypothetical protein
MAQARRSAGLAQFSIESPQPADTSQQPQEGLWPISSLQSSRC